MEKKGEDEDLLFLSREILSATSFSSVLIHFELIPSGDPISNPQKNLAKAQPARDFLDVCRVQFSALVLSVIFKITG